MTALIRGGYTVLPHVQAFADAVQEHGWADSFGTYAGHDPTPERALDIFVPVDDPETAAAICAFGIANQAQFGIWYEMSRQHIWNVERASEGWRPQSPYDRGSLTANHYDHVHVSFYATAIPQEEDDMFTDADRQLLRDIHAYDAEEKDHSVTDTPIEAVGTVVNQIVGKLDALEAKVDEILNQRASQ